MEIKATHLLWEISTNGYIYSSLDIITIISIFCSVLVIASKNPIVSVLYLIFLFITIALYLMLLGFNFIGLSYLLVYVGAVSILFIFILMLINVRVSELTTNTRNSIPLAVFTGIALNLSLYYTLPTNGSEISLPPYGKGKEITYLVTSHDWDINLIDFSHISSIGNVIYTSFPMWLILTSIILLLSMIGAISITIKK